MDPEQNITAQRIVHGKVTEKRTNQYNLYASGGNGSGTQAMEYVGKNGEVNQETHGGGNMFVVGLGDKGTAAALDTFKDLAGENILVRILGYELKKPFERKFKPSTLLKEIKLDLMEEEKKFFRLFRDGTELDGNLTLAQAAYTGSTTNWEAVP